MESRLSIVEGRLAKLVQTATGSRKMKLCAALGAVKRAKRYIREARQEGSRDGS